MIELERSLCWTTIALPLVMAACERPATNDDWQGTVETLPNGMVRVIKPAQGIWESSEPWRLLPDLQLGRLEGPDQEIFAAIAAIEVDQAGRVYVLDRTANELRIFGPDGTHVRTVGRSGGGPGEYAFVGKDELDVQRVYAFSIEGRN